MRLSNPIENLRIYIMVHGGVDRHERLLDVEWVNDLHKAARALCVAKDGIGFEECLEQLGEVLKEVKSPDGEAPLRGVREKRANRRSTAGDRESDGEDR